MDDSAFLEDVKVKKLRRLVDDALTIIKRERLYGRKAWQIYDNVKAEALSLFPDDDELFELVYFSRFSRLIWENALFNLELEEKKEI